MGLMVWNCFVSFPSLTEFAVGAFKDVMLEVTQKSLGRSLTMNTVNIAGGQGQLIHEITREWQAREVRCVCKGWG